MRVSVLPNTLAFEGVLNEETSMSDLTNAFKELKDSGAKEPFVLDLSKVKRANSSGIVTWLRFLKDSGSRFKYINCPVWLVRQFNMIEGYFNPGTVVESIHAPFFCEQNQFAKSIILKLGGDVPILQSYTDFQLPNQEFEGNSYEPDFDPEQYFHFIAANFDNFKGSIK